MGLRKFRNFMIIPLALLIVLVMTPYSAAALDLVGILLNDPIELHNYIFTGDNLFWNIVNGFITPNVTEAGTAQLNVSAVNAWDNLTAPKICLNQSCRTSWLAEAEVNMWVDGGDYLYPNSTYADNVMIFGWLNVTSWLNVWADSVIHGDLNVTDNLIVTGNISGDRLFVSSATISGNADISGNATITGNADISGDANVSGNQSLTGDLTIGGRMNDDNSSTYTYFNENGTYIVHLES